MRRKSVVYEVWFIRDFGRPVYRGWALDRTLSSLRDARSHVRKNIASDVPTRIDRVTRETVSR